MSADAGQNVETKPKADSAAAAAPAAAEPVAPRPYLSINEPHFIHETGGVEEGRTNALKLGILAILIMGVIAIALAFIFRAMEKAVGPKPTSITDRARIGRDGASNALPRGQHSGDSNRSTLAEHTADHH